MPKLAALPLITFTAAALENVEECGVNVAQDLAALKAGRKTSAALLAECLDGADPDRIAGWNDYVTALTDAALESVPVARKARVHLGRGRVLVEEVMRARLIRTELRLKAHALYPAEPEGDIAATERAWEAYFDAQEEIDVRVGVNVASVRCFELEQALISWGADLPAVRETGLDLRDGMTIATIRERLIDILLRVAA